MGDHFLIETDLLQQNQSINHSTIQKTPSHSINQSINQLISPVTFYVHPINQSMYQSRGIVNIPDQSIN